MTKIYNLISGVDGGNIKTKVSYLDENGTIKNFAIPTVMAPADITGDPFKDQADLNDITDIDRLHVYVQSKSLPKNYYYFGDFARDKEGMAQPDGEEKNGNELHIGTTILGLALAAAKEKKTEVNVIYSGGLPIEEHKIIDTDKTIANLIGDHMVEFLDGLFKGSKVLIHILDGTVRVEGITSSLALKYDIENNKIKPVEHITLSQNEYIIGDLGAGTTDLALYDKDGLNGKASTNLLFGTNHYIDLMIQDITALPEFSVMRSHKGDGGKETKLFRNRDEFVNDVIKPVLTDVFDQLVKAKDSATSSNIKYKFTASWAYVHDVDITEIVIKHMTSYCQEAENALKTFWFTKAQKIKDFAIVGGGIAFGYIIFKDTLSSFKLPPIKDLKDAAFITSKSYLIANFVDQQAKLVG
jgi:plasmid segregation protein ParM